MQTMEFSKADQMVIDSEKVVQNFNDEELIRKDEEAA